MIPCFGDSGSQVPAETQMLLLEASEESSVHGQLNSAPNGSGGTFYILILPVLEGQFRACLQGTVINEIEKSVESGWFFYIFVHIILGFLL